MSRAASDVVIGIAGAIAITFMLVGVFAYEYNNVPGPHIPGPEDGISSQSHADSLAQGGSFTGNFTPSIGVVGMDITIEWTPTAPSVIPGASSFSYQLTAPDGTILHSGTSSESVDLKVTVPETGEYLLTLSAPAPSAGGAFDAEATYDY